MHTGVKELARCTGCVHAFLCSARLIPIARAFALRCCDLLFTLVGILGFANVQCQCTNGFQLVSEHAIKWQVSRRERLTYAQMRTSMLYQMLKKVEALASQLPFCVLKNLYLENFDYSSPIATYAPTLRILMGIEITIKFRQGLTGCQSDNNSS